MIEILKSGINKNAWLFLAAAWLYTLSFIFTNYFSYSASAGKVAKTISEYIQGQERSFNTIVRDSATVAAIVADTPTRAKEDLITDVQGIFAYEVNDIGNPIEIYWNTNKMSVAANDLYEFDGSYVVNYQNGIFEYIKKTTKINNATYILCTLIPVQWHYFLQNQYLKTGFALREEINSAYEITIAGNGAPVKNISGNTIFSIKEKPKSASDSPGVFSILLRLTALAFLLFFVSNIAGEIVRRKNFVYGFGVLVASFILLRILTVFVPFPFNYHSLLLFNTSVYNGSFLNRTLGDLLFNSILILWIVIFFRRFYRAGHSFSKIRLYKLRPFYKYSFFMLIPLFTFFIADIISSLVTRSNIGFNAADFFSLSVFSFSGFV